MPHAALLIALALLLVLASLPGQGAATDPRQGALNVRDFGAKGDGKSDDTAALQAALDAAAQGGGGLVFVPTGDYLVKGSLSVPEHVVLEGVWRAPTARSQGHGSTLLAVAGAGQEGGTPFITLHTNSTLHGLTVFYPEQTNTNPPQAYPWTIRGAGDNCSIIDVLLVNPYQAVDFGTQPAGRHYIRGLYAQALRRGIFVDKCFDIGRISDVHLWPFWEISGDAPARRFTLEQGEAFIFGRTDWEYVNNCFCIGYAVGFHFRAFGDGGGNVLFTQSGSDVGPLAVLVDNVQDHSGISFSNCQMMAGVVVKDTNRGPVKFTSCGFWGIDQTTSHADLAGSGNYLFEGCHFVSWGQKDPQAPCLVARGGGLTVIGCDFLEEGKPQIRLGPEVVSAVITGNRLRGGAKITNESTGDVQMGLNTQR